MRNHRPLLAATFASALFLFAPACPAAAYTVFDWNGRSAPTEPTGPPYAPSSTTTVYTGAQYYDSGLGSVQPMTVTFSVIPIIYASESSNPGFWFVDPAGLGSTYGYQSPDEAEWRFGASGAEIQLQITMDFSHSVFNPSFMLLDIDNLTSDEITSILAVTGSNSTIYPSVSLVAGSVVRVQGSGPSLMLDSNGGNATDTEAFGDAFLEWSMGGITHLEFTWKGKSGTSIRMGNIYAEFDPAGFTQMSAESETPEPGSMFLGALGLGVLSLLRRRGR